MAITPTKMAVVTVGLGIVSFTCGVLAELKRPPAGEPIQANGVVICKYNSLLSVLLGYIAFACLVASTTTGYYLLFYPYQGKSIPQIIAFSNRWFISYFHIALGTTGLAVALVLWPTITEHINTVNNFHTNPNSDCPTVQQGLIGGGAFMSLNASLFWFVSLMLISNVREDYFGKAGDVDDKSSEYDPKEPEVQFI